MENGMGKRAMLIMKSGKRQMTELPKQEKIRTLGDDGDTDCNSCTWNNPQ